MADSNEPLIPADRESFEFDPPHPPHHPSPSPQSDTPSAYVWILTAIAGISGLLFGCLTPPFRLPFTKNPPSANFLPVQTTPASSPLLSCISPHLSHPPPEPSYPASPNPSLPPLPPSPRFSLPRSLAFSPTVTAANPQSTSPTCSLSSVPYGRLWHSPSRIWLSGGLLLDWG